ncbi:MAG: PAS domain S-box protein [Deltaproteobacteria bacterium]|nr:PAS domain S-box protein [Deltaproteobacteria bacterium]
MTALDHYLRDQQPFLESVFNAIQDGIIVLDRNFTIVRTNRWMESKYASHMPLIDKKCHAVLRNRKDSCLTCTCSVSLETGKPYIEVVPYPSGQNPTEWFEISVFRIEDVDGKVMGALGHVKDITERRQAEELLKDEVTRRRILVEQSRDGIVVLEQNGKVYEANQEFAHMLGYSLDEVNRLHVWDWDAQFNKQQLMEMLQFIDDTGDHFETRHRRKDGTFYDVEISTNGAVYRGQKLIFCVCRDITERITDRKNNEKQKLIMESHLRQAQKMEALGSLAGGIAHDFNNILSAIYGYAELAQLRCSEHSKLRHYIDQIGMASLRAKKLVQQILTFSRQGKSEKRILDISSVIEETLKLIRATFPATIEIRQNIKSDPGAVVADETQIHQVFMNLCTNAFHSMEKEGGLLEVELVPVRIGVYDSSSYPVISPGNYLKLVVSDTGHGMDQDTLAQIFNPYFTTKKTGEGTGMGLSTVHGIVKDHGGSIKVYSRPGVGTTFQVFLPLAETDPDHSTAETRLFSSSTGYILFVDDEKQLTEIGNELLEGLGYLVETRVNPIDAINAFRMNPNKYDLIITDMTMPKMTGEKLAKAIKKIRPDIPIILCTGFSATISADTLTEIGVSQVLMKPVTSSQLANAVRRVMDGQVP